jgi:hypothetical protein
MGYIPKETKAVFEPVPDLIVPLLDLARIAGCETSDILQYRADVNDFHAASSTHKSIGAYAAMKATADARWARMPHSLTANTRRQAGIPSPDFRMGCQVTAPAVAAVRVAPGSVDREPAGPAF